MRFQGRRTALKHGVARGEVQQWAADTGAHAQAGVGSAHWAPTPMASVTDVSTQALSACRWSPGSRSSADSSHWKHTLHAQHARVHGWGAWGTCAHVLG